MVIMGRAGQTSPPCPPLLEKRRGGGMVIMGRAGRESGF